MIDQKWNFQHRIANDDGSCLCRLGTALKHTIPYMYVRFFKAAPGSLVVLVEGLREGYQTLMEASLG